MAKVIKKYLDEQDGARSILATAVDGKNVGTATDTNVGTATGNVSSATGNVSSATGTATDYLDQALEMLSKQPEVTYTPGIYQSQYSEQIDSIINDILNAKYQGYDHTTDPTYSQYKKTYLREADRTAEDVLGQYAALTGGMPSTAAVSAASQAGNYYKGLLADKIPELEATAYERYLSELSGKRQNLSDLTALEELAYGLWQGNEAQKQAAYQQKQTEFDTALNRLLQGAEIAQTKEDSEASKALNQLYYGVMPSEAGLAALGIDEETAKSLMVGTESTSLSEETALALLQLSIENKTIPSDQVLAALGLDENWASGAVENAVATANGEDVSVKGGYVQALNEAMNTSGEDEMYEYLASAVEKGLIDEEEMIEIGEDILERKKQAGEYATQQLLAYLQKGILQ